MFVYALPSRVATGWDVWTEHTVFICVGDITGHGNTAIPGAFHVQAWLRGRLSSQPGLPRLDEIVHGLSDELEAVDIAMSAAFVILKIRPESPASTMLECVSCGLFPPILVEGPRQRVLGSSDFGSSLPLRGSAIAVRQSPRLTGPWKLAGGTDGFLSRVGNGAEQEGMAAIRSQLTRGQDGSFYEFCETELPALDDELAFLFQPAERWDVEVECASEDTTAKTRFLRLVEQDLERRQRIERLGPGSSMIFDQGEPRAYSPWGNEDTFYFPLRNADRIWMIRAVQEAIINAVVHGSRDETDSILLRFRDEGSALRVVVEDSGARMLGSSSIKSSEGGFKIMRTVCPSIFLEYAPGGGNRLILLKDRASQTNS